MSGSAELARDARPAAPVYGLVHRDWEAIWEQPTIVANRMGPDYGGRVWHIALTYRLRSSRQVLTVHTVYKLSVPSLTDSGWVESGSREAKSIVAGELVRPAQAALDASYRPWDSASLVLDGVEREAELLTTGRGEGRVVDMGSCIVGVVGPVPDCGMIGRVAMTIPEAVPDGHAARSR